MSIHKRLHTPFSIFATLALVICFAAISKAQSIITDDAHTINSAKDADSNFGTNPNLLVSSVNNTYLKFKLTTTLPTDTHGSDVAKATLKLYVGTVTSPGAIDVYQASAAWNEKTVTANAAPNRLAFDGANIWVVNVFSSNVMKLDASTGAVLGTFPLGLSPFDILFDGVNMWVSNAGGNSVTKLRASDGAHLGTFTPGFGPAALGFDGVNIWVANSFNKISKLRASDGSLVSTVTYDPNIAFLFDGTSMWITHNPNLSKLSLR